MFNIGRNQPVKCRHGIRVPTGIKAAIVHNKLVSEIRPLRILGTAHDLVVEFGEIVRHNKCNADGLHGKS